MLDKKQIGNRLMCCRKEKGVSREKVAFDLGISASSLFKYETGERTPRDEVKVALAEYYNSTVEAIFFAA